MNAKMICIPEHYRTHMGLFKRDDSPDHIPRKVQESIEKIRSAIESVKTNATEADLSISFEGMSLKSAIEDSSRLIAFPRCLEEDSMTRIKRIAGSWSGLAELLEATSSGRTRIQEATERNPGSTDSGVRAEAEKLERIWNEMLIMCLRHLKDGLGR